MFFTHRPSQAEALRAAPPIIYKVTLKLTTGLSSLLDIYGAFLGRHIALDQQQSSILHGLINFFMISQKLNLLTQPGLSGIEVDSAAIPLRTDGRSIAWAFWEQDQARSFAQGLQFIVTHRLTQEQVEAARAHSRAGRGLRWSPLVSFWE